jgi:acetyl-CoA synthetase
VIVRSADTSQVGRRRGDYTRIAVGEPVDGWLAYA